jgi:integrase/recombinase XerD
MEIFVAVETYIDRKRSLGVTFEKAALNLRSFSKRVGDVPLETITPGQILRFLNGPRTSTVTWRVKYKLLKNFFEYWAARGMLPVLPMPVIRPPVPRTFVPYIYSRNEVRMLLGTARESQRPATCSIDSATLRIFLVFLYATGAFVGEALGLLQEDVDLKKGAITIRGSPHRCRLTDQVATIRYSFRSKAHVMPVFLSGQAGQGSELSHSQGYIPETTALGGNS